MDNVHGVKCFFLLRVLLAAEIPLEDVHRWGRNVSEELRWLSDMYDSLRTVVGYELPAGPDSMNLH